tara:strand:- start:1397 stop:1726 length:330 start_codon:yes stop_codon:yes gene_type:complete
MSYYAKKGCTYKIYNELNVLLLQTTQQKQIRPVIIDNFGSCPEFIRYGMLTSQGYRVERTKTIELKPVLDKEMNVFGCAKLKQRPTREYKFIVDEETIGFYYGKTELLK